MSNHRKQVSQSKYNRQYYVNLYSPPDYSKKLYLKSFGHTYRELAKIQKLSPLDKVVDFGCGNGELSFCLHHVYKSKVTGVDYSEDAIKVSQKSLHLYKKNYKNPKISFLNFNNTELPKLSNINYVYFCDVLEHMYNHEIALVLKKVKTWNKQKIKIIVHTDNDIYLRFARPILDTIAILTMVSTLAEIKTRNLWESERHVNLTNPKRLGKYLSSLGFRQKRLLYSVANEDKVVRQLGKLSKYNFLKRLSLVFLRFFKFLSPSFYCIYEYEH